MEKEEKKITMELNKNEAFIIRRWREKYRFGEITIKVHEGIPQGIEKVILKDYPQKDGN